MAETYYDVNQFGDETFSENVTEDDVKKSQGSKLPVGWYVMEVSKIDLKQLTHLTPPAMGLHLEMTVVESQEKTGEDKFKYTGIKTTDDVAMPKAGEKDWVKNRRVQVARAFEIIPVTGGAITKDMWLSILKKKVLVKIVVAQKKNKATGVYEDTEFTQVALFDGYKSLASMAKMNAAGAGNGNGITKTAVEITADDI